MGKKGNDVILRVPCGTVISEVYSDEEYEFLREMQNDADLDYIDKVYGNIDPTENNDILGLKPIDIERHNQMVLVAEGGKPGLGNALYAGTASRRALAVPNTHVPGQRGQHRSLLLELKIIADVGLVG